jgi:hypothetical protein
MTHKTFFTLALLLTTVGLVAGGCAGKDDDKQELAQSSPRTTHPTESPPAESPDQAEPSRTEPKPEPNADSAPKRIGRDQQRELLSASEKLQKKLGVALKPPSAERCMHIQGDPRLTRLIEGNGVCNRPSAPEPDAAPPTLDQPSPTIPNQR